MGQTMGGQSRRIFLFGAIVAIVAIAFFVTPLAACETGATCATESAGAPVVLKKFSKPQIRAGKRAYTRKSATSRKARTSKQAERKIQTRKPEVRDADASGKSAFGANVKQASADAKAELTGNDASASKAVEATVEATEAAPLPPQNAQLGTDPVTAATKIMEAEEFNDIDRTAWEAESQPRLMQLAVMDSRAEIRADDSKWSQTSMIGKMFVAFGLLLTVGSAIRMLWA